jgi:undecaprenyl-diphosphatase
MSIPITFGAGLLKMGDLKSGVAPVEFVVGMGTAAVVGFLSIRYLLKLLARKDFTMFVWYRIGFAVLITVVYFVRT